MVISENTYRRDYRFAGRNVNELKLAWREMSAIISFDRSRGFYLEKATFRSLKPRRK